MLLCALLNPVVQWVLIDVWMDDYTPDALDLFLGFRRRHKQGITQRAEVTLA
jgi:hypothetical protein